MVSISLVTVVAAVLVVFLGIAVARIPVRDPVLAMAFGFLLVLAGGFLLIGTHGLIPAVVSLVLLVAGLATGSAALRGGTSRLRDQERSSLD